MNTKTLDRIKSLKREAGALGGFHAHYDAKYRSDSNCDKKGYGFGDDRRFAAFEIKTSFDSHAGYYGNSSCGTILNIYDKALVEPFIIKALNVHQKEIFATAARLMREEAASLSGKAADEIRALQKMVDDLSLPEPDPFSAANAA